MRRHRPVTAQCTDSVVFPEYHFNINILAQNAPAQCFYFLAQWPPVAMETGWTTINILCLLIIPRVNNAMSVNTNLYVNVKLMKICVVKSLNYPFV